jgi:two-component system chemotaxis response regulator CheV|tara:strand:- start:8211 stop:9152 length:942 start_codon:yes stop_codon:yes gene_type:complete
MRAILEQVDARTDLVGQNRFEILMFNLTQGKKFAINVFKVQEVQRMPALTQIPKSHQVVRGVTTVRERTIPVIDLSMAIGMIPLECDESSNIIITEYNRSVQAFMIRRVDRIVNLSWDSVRPPPPGLGRNHYLTAITEVDDDIIEIIDVEKVLSEVMPFRTEISEGVLADNIRELTDGMQVMIVDDSTTAITHLRNTVESLGMEAIIATDGMSGLTMLKSWADEGIDVAEKIAILITDAEMPQMDGYSLTAECRKDPRLQDLHIVLHTSLSGTFNQAMVDKVGCDGFLSKFQPDDLAQVLQERVMAIHSNPDR